MRAEAEEGARREKEREERRGGAGAERVRGNSSPCADVCCLALVLLCRGERRTSATRVAAFAKAQVHGVGVHGLLAVALQRFAARPSRGKEADFPVF